MNLVYFYIVVCILLYSNVCKKVNITLAQQDLIFNPCFQLQNANGKSIQITY